MLVEPSIDRAALVADLERHYGFAVDATGLEFVPVGFAAACYRAGDHFVKLWVTGESLEVLDVALPLLVHLSARMGSARVVAPIPAADTGALSVRLAGSLGAVFPFVAGAPPQDPWPRAPLILGELHSLDPLPKLPFAVDGLDMGPAEGLARLLEHCGDDAPDVARQLERLADARDRALGSGRVLPLVLCHTDFGRDNLIEDPHTGEFTVVDWDWARLGPPEYDVRIAVECDDPTAFLTRYQAAGGVADLDLARFEFYLLRRYLEDYAARLVRLLAGGLSPEEASDAREGMHLWGARLWSRLDATIARLGAM